MSACVVPSNQLQIFWDNFFHCETGTYEKSKWLDLFLAEYLLQLKNGAIIKDLLNFCPIGAIVTLVGCELLCGVHVVTSSSCSGFEHSAKDVGDYFSLQSSSQVDDKISIEFHIDNGEILSANRSQSNFSNLQMNNASKQALKKLLLKGSAWRCLSLLQSLGVEGLSCNRQLSGILIWMFGELSGMGGTCHGRNIYLPQSSVKPPIDELFRNKNRINSMRKKKLNETFHHDKTPTTHIIKPRKDIRSSSSECSGEELELLNRSFTLKPKLLKEKEVPSEEDDFSNGALYSPMRRNESKKKAFIEDYVSDRHRDVMNSEISLYEFNQMAVDLLYELCKSETSTNHSEGMHISVQCINFSLKYLCILQFESSPASHINFSFSEATHLKTSLTELLMLSFDKVLMHPDLFKKNIASGILPMLLRILEDAVYKLQVRLQMLNTYNVDRMPIKTKQESMDKAESTDWAKYLFGISYSILVFFYCLLVRQCSVDKIHEFVEQYKLFGDCHNGFMIRDAISLMLSLPMVETDFVNRLIKKEIILISKLVIELKLVRNEIVHSISCSKSKHRMCQSNSSLSIQHHHDIFGTSFSSSNMSLSTVCAVSTFYATLASLLSDNAFIRMPDLRLKLLKSLQNCGSCCCFSPQFLLERIIKIIQLHNSLANLCFMILEQTLYGDLGVTNTTNVDGYICNTCYLKTVHNGNKMEFPNTTSKSTSFVINETNQNILKYSLSENIPISNDSAQSQEFHITWPFLSKYIPLLQSSNMPMLRLTINHMLTMLVQGKYFIKHDLLFQVLYPAFVMAKSRYLLTNNDCSYFVTMSCLNIFTNLLSFPMFAREFIQKEGLNDILDIISLPEFSKQCCSILEIATVTQIFNKNLNSLKSEVPTMDDNHLEKLPSLQMVMKSLENITRKCFYYFKVKVDHKTFMEITKLSKAEESPFTVHTEECDSSPGNRESVSQSSTTTTDILLFQYKGINGSHPKDNSSAGQSISHYMEILKTFFIFWKTCAALCLYSPILRRYFVKKKVLNDSFKILQLVLHCFEKVPCTQSEYKILMRILEVILIIYITLSECTMEKSKLVTIELLNKILNNKEDVCIDLNNVKMLCDMLIRVASTQPSNVQVMPPTNSIKLPPVTYSTNSYNNETSSDEDSDLDDLYKKQSMSDGSDNVYHSADEGYEADVELGVVDSQAEPSDTKLDQSVLNDNLNSYIKYTTDSVINNIGSDDAECVEYKRLNIVTYPELSCIVLNVVLNLIDRILMNEEESSSTLDVSDVTNVVCSCLSKMSTLFFNDVNGSSVNGFILQILQSPSVTILKRCLPHLEDLQHSLLKLLSTLASKSIPPKELKLYLSLFNDSEAPLKILLEPLQKLSETVQPNVPDFIVCFPVNLNPSTVSFTPAEQQAFHSISNAELNASQIENYAVFLHQEHVKAGLRSCWSKMGMWCPIDGVNWGLWLEGCSITMWMMLRDTQTHSRTQSKTSFYSTSDESCDDDNCIFETPGSHKSERNQKIHSLLYRYPSHNWSNDSTSLAVWLCPPQSSQPHPNQQRSPGGLRTSHRVRWNIYDDHDSQVQMYSETDILNVLHLVSIGHDSVMIEFWVNVVNGDVLIQLTQPAHDCNHIIGEGVLKCCVNIKCWNHLSINIKEVTHQKTLCIEVTMFVNGIKNHTTIPLKGILLHRIRPAYLVIGHSTPSDLSPSSRPRGSWFLSNLSVFRAPILTQHSALYLMAFGPDIKPLTNCQLGNQVPNFGSLFTPGVVSTDMDWDQVIHLSPNRITHMQESLLLMYSAHNANNVDIYHQTSAHSSVFKLTSPQCKVGHIAIPTSKTVYWMGNCLSSQHSGFSPSLFLIGGPNILLHLYARIVEMESASDVQTSALSILLKVSLADARLYSMFQQDELLNLLHIVFASKKCNVDYLLLKTLLDAACDKSILIRCNNVLQIMNKVNVIIKYPEILIAMIKAWRELERAVQPNNSQSKAKTKLFETSDIDEELLQDSKKVLRDEKWDKSVELVTEENSLLGVLLRCINIMLRDENPCRQFNVYQLNRHNMVGTLLMFCKERFLYSDLGLLSDIVSYHLVELIRSLMGCPPYIQHISLIADFLILMHDSGSTYITQSKSSIYFVLSDSNSKKKKKTHKAKPTVVAEDQNAVPRSSDRNISTTDRDLNEDTEMSTFNITENVSAVDAEIPSTSGEPQRTDLYDNRDIEISNPTSTSSPLSRPSTSARIINESNLDVPAPSEPVPGASESSSTAGTVELAKEYDVVGSDEVTPEKKNPLMLYQKLPSPVLSQSLKSDLSRSWTVCEGFLLLLRDTVSIVPDTYLPQVLRVLLETEMLLVLANHQEVSMRSAVVKVIAAILQRCSLEDVKRFHDKNYFYNLANQISQLDASYELVSACTSLVTGRRAVLEDQLEEDAWYDVREGQLGFSLPLIAILTSTLHDVSLTHNTSLLFRKIISLASVKALVSIGIVESIVKCLRQIGSIPDINFDGRELLLNDMRQLLKEILLKVLTTEKNSHLYMDMYNSLVYLDLIERKRSFSHLKQCHVLTTVRDTYCYLLQEELTFFQTLLEMTYNKKNKKRPSAISAGSDQGSSEAGLSSTRLSKSAPTRSAKFMNIRAFPRVYLIISPPEDTISEYSNSELKDKVIALLRKAADFFMQREWKMQMSDYETATIEIIFLLIANISSGKISHFRVKWWKKLMVNECHGIMWDLFMWLISPMQKATLKLFAAQTVFESWDSVEKILSPSDPRKQRKLAVYLVDLVNDLPENEIRNEKQTLKSFIESWARSLEFEHLDLESLEGETNYLVDKDNDFRERMLKENYNAILKSVFSKNNVVRSITDSAKAGSQGVVDIHYRETKNLMDQIKKQDSVYVASCHKWQKILSIFGHERGVWFNEGSYPMSWELDPTEGPAKVRIRLRRCHLDVDKKFMKSSFKYKIDRSQTPQPLSYLFERTTKCNYLDCLHMNEIIGYMAPAVYVTVKCEQEGELILSSRCIHFFPEAKDSNNFGGIYVPLENITVIQKRRWRLTERAVEITLLSGHTHFMAFKEPKEMENFLQALNSCSLPFRENPESLSHYANLWRNGEITNWEYLMQLNSLAGRTYNDLMQYPVLPFIIADYTSTKLDLGKVESFRNLKKPVAVQDPNNEKTYIENYNNLKEKAEERLRECTMGCFTDEPFHYGSHYSNSATVLHFLVRLPPFTKQFILFQDGNFDMPDRTFHSLNTAWRLAGCVSQSSCKELTPEFFYQPRMFTNDEGFNFGIRQCGVEINNVEMPKWCRNSRIFTLIHRQALESPYVRENIPFWIDLIFGYKQTGDAAIEAVNVFHPSTYHGYKPTLSDNVQREALDTMIRTYGQTPRQLLKLPHPQCITNLKHVPESVEEVLASVSGLRWGFYCCSPQQPTPWLVWSKKTKPMIEKLIPLSTGEVIGLPSQATVLVVYAKSSSSHPIVGTSIATIAAITWGHSDGTIRIKQRKDCPPEPLFHVQNLDEVTVVSHAIGNTLGGLWIGLRSGRIVVLQASPVFTPSSHTIKFSRQPAYLYGHNSAITGLSINAAFGVVVSTCTDGLINVWDLHNLTLIRCLPTCNLPLNLICVSDTLCDVCSVYELVTVVKDKEAKSDSQEPKVQPSTSTASATSLPSDKKIKPNERIVVKSKLRVQTINGMLVGDVKVPDKVTSVCYSNAPEGVSVNSIIVGLETGGIRIYSSWDLRPLNTLMSLVFSGPLNCICYSYDAHYLYMVGHDGTVMVWESDSIKGKIPGFRQFSSLPIF